MPDISDHDFRAAMTEAYNQFSDAMDSLVQVRVRRRAGRSSAAAQKKAEGHLDECQRSIVWVLGGMLGLYLPADNTAVLRRVRELCRQAKHRSECTCPRPRSEGKVLKGDFEREPEEKGDGA